MCFSFFLPTIPVTLESCVKDSSCSTGTRVSPDCSQCKSCINAGSAAQSPPSPSTDNTIAHNNANILEIVAPQISNLNDQKTTRTFNKLIFLGTSTLNYLLSVSTAERQHQPNRIRHHPHVPGSRLTRSTALHAYAKAIPLLDLLGSRLTLQNMGSTCTAPTSPAITVFDLQN